MCYLFTTEQQDTSVGVSVFTLTVLSFDRYTAIERRVPFLRGPKPKLVIAICVSVIWVTSIGLALPAALFSHLLKIPLGNVTEESVEQTNGTAIVDHGGEIVVCYPFPQEFGPVYAKTVVLVRFIVHYFQPLLIISTFYAIMTHHLLRRLIRLKLNIHCISQIIQKSKFCIQRPHHSGSGCFVDC
jgi:hypothetical protein